MDKNCKKETCASKWQEDYNKYLQEEKCREEREDKEIMSRPDNTYGLNEEYACQFSRLRVYMNYTGKDRLNWGKNE